MGIVLTTSLKHFQVLVVKHLSRNFQRNAICKPVNDQTFVLHMTAIYSDTGLQSAIRTVIKNSSEKRN